MVENCLPDWEEDIVEEHVVDAALVHYTLTHLVRLNKKETAGYTAQKIHYPSANHHAIHL